MVALLALAAAFGWGTSDYAAGVASRRATAMSVVILTHLTATLALVAVSIDWAAFGELSVRLGDDGPGGRSLQIRLPDLGIVGSPRGVDLLWGLAAGVSGGIGALLLYQGLAKGSMAVVAPVTAAGAAALPATYGLLSGDRSSPVLLGGIVLALLAITLVSSVASPDEPRPATDAGGAGFEPAPVLAAAGRSSGVPVADTLLVDRALVAIRAVEADRAAAGGAMTPYLLGTAAAVIAGAVAAMTTSSLLGADGPPPAGVFLFAFGLVALASAGASGVGRLAGGRRLRRTRDGVPGGGRARVRRPGLAEALGSGVGFAGFYILTARTGADAGLWPMVGARGASFVMFTVAALVTGAATVLPPSGARRTVLLAGVLDAAAAGLFLVATRTGSLAVVSVLSSMYPGVTVLLARAITKERCSRLQLVGLGVAATAVGLIAVG